MDTPKPIKRTGALIELSRDHHFALLLVWRIRLGLKQSIEPERISKYVLYAFENELLQHFKEEENLLFSELQQEDKMKMQAEEEHTVLYELIKNIELNLNSKNFLENFADTLEKHIRFEERQLFNIIQQTFPKELQLQIESQIAPRNRKTEYCDVFWK